ncbi:hypothetical protein BGZ93_006141 [Podila epicladia]|nr:hypothetical protein BGZ92_009477 [Podila epicladia]KAG0095248.1 hypothetical protein BGZ93_006141 [Podila epicladia]
MALPTLTAPTATTALTNSPTVDTATTNTPTSSSGQAITPTPNKTKGVLATSHTPTTTANNIGLPSPPVGLGPESPHLPGNGFSNSPGPIIGALAAVLMALLVAGLFVFKQKKTNKTEDTAIGKHKNTPRLRHPEDTEGSLPSVTSSLNGKEVYVIDSNMIESKKDKRSSLDNKVLMNIDDMNRLIRNPHLPIPHFQLYLGPHAVVEQALDGSIPGSPLPQGPHAIRYQVMSRQRSITTLHGSMGERTSRTDAESELPLEQQFALLMVQQQNLERIRQEQEAEPRCVRARLLAERKDTHETEGEEGYLIQEGWSTAATVSWPRPPGDNRQVVEIPEEVKSREVALDTRQQGWSIEAAVSWPGAPESRVIEIPEEVEVSDEDDRDSTIHEPWPTETYVPRRNRRALFPPAFPIAYKHASDKSVAYPINPA